jgi:hypothetical protein
MDRREFLTCSLVSGAALALPSYVLGSTATPRHKPLVLNILAFPRIPRHWERGKCLNCEYLAGEPEIDFHPYRLEIGDKVDLAIKSYDMGHYTIGLYHAGVEIREFQSSLVGGFLDRNMPLCATVSDFQNGIFRVEILLDTEVTQGTPIPLLDPIQQKAGIRAQFAEDIAPPKNARAEWISLRAIPNHLYFVISHPSPLQPTIDSSPYNSTPMQLIQGLRELGPAQQRIWSDLPWEDLQPAAPALTIDGEDLAYIPIQFENNFSQLLMRGERLEAKILRSGNGAPRETFVDLRLIT